MFLVSCPASSPPHPLWLQPFYSFLTSNIFLCRLFCPEKRGRKGLLYLKSVNGVLVHEGKLASLEPSLTERELFHFHLQHTCCVRPALTFVLLWEAFGGLWIVSCPLWWLLGAGGFCSSWWLWGIVPSCLGGAQGMRLGRILCLALCGGV